MRTKLGRCLTSTTQDLLLLSHIAFNISDLSELQEQKIKKHRDGSYYVYVSDPDDNVIEKIYWDVVKK